MSVCTSVRPYICPSGILSVCSILSGRYLLNRATIFNQTWYGGVLSRGKLSGRKKLVHYRQCQGHIEDFACPFATKLGLVVQHYKPECSAEKVDYCVQGQGHSEDKKCQ